MKKTTLVFIFITIISQIFGFARDITLSFFYGTTNSSDAYLISQTIPMMIFSFIAIGITTGYIPMYSKIESDLNEIEGERFTNNLVSILIILSNLFVLFGLVFTKEIVKVFASGFNNETLKLTIDLTRISIFGIYFIGILSVFTGFLQIKRNYYITAFISVPMNFFILLSIFVSKKTDITVLAIGSVVATASQLLFIIPSIRKTGFRYKFVFDLKDENIRTMGKIALPVIIGFSVNQINLLVDRTVASQISEGAISALTYSNRLTGFIHAIFVTSISTVMYPVISKMAAEKNTGEFKKSITDSIGSINLFVIPITVGFIIFAEPITRFLFGRGMFDDKAIAMTSNALVFYSVGMLAFGLRDVFSRAFYSMQDTKTPMINATIAMVLNIVLIIFLSKFLGVGGLALAASIAGILCSFMLFISLRKKIGSFGVKSIMLSVLKIVVSSLIMGIIARFAYNTLLKNINENLALFIAIGIGAFTYLVLVSILRNRELNFFKYAVISRFKKSEGF